MPVAPRKPCRICGALSNGSYCGQHQKKKEEQVRAERIKYDQVRGTRTERGYSNRWLKVSKLYRQEHPLCVMCEKKGILKLAECVDHIIAVSGPDDPLFYEPSNWQSLCHSCHSEKTAKEDGGLGNKKVERFI